MYISGTFLIGKHQILDSFLRALNESDSPENLHIYRKHLSPYLLAQSSKTVILFPTKSKRVVVRRTTGLNNVILFRKLKLITNKNSKHLHEIHRRHS